VNRAVFRVPRLSLRTGNDVEAIHSEADGEFVAVIELDERFKDLRVHAFAGLLGAGVLAAELAAEAKDATQNFQLPNASAVT
jgi:hypothetical protein